MRFLLLMVVCSCLVACQPTQQPPLNATVEVVEETATPVILVTPTMDSPESISVVVTTSNAVDFVVRTNPQTEQCTVVYISAGSTEGTYLTYLGPTDSYSAHFSTLNAMVMHVVAVCTAGNITGVGIWKNPAH